ncbi:MAG: M24 family metallopeptidase, partial [Actinobacteria bacterium]|nr:M24 family metallopeptidase [Actinomycetota bacterium]
MNRAEEVAAKLDSVRAWLDDSDLDAVLLSEQGGFAWVTAGGDNHVTLGQEVGAASVLVTRDEAYLLASNIELHRLVEEQVAGAPLTPVEWPWHEDGGEGRVVERLCDPARTVSDVGSLGLPPAPPELAELRTGLLPSEIERYRLLGVDAAEAVEVTCLSARPGDREVDVAARLAFECTRRGITALVNLVGVDERIAQYRHPRPSDRPLAHTLLVALSGRRHGLHASLTRMIHGGPADADLVHRHAAVVRVDARLIAESHPDAVLGDVFDRGLEQYQREGFAAEWRLHHQGGLTGYAGREVFATGFAHQVLRADQVVAWNPSITRVKSEDTVLITPEGPEVLTRSPAWPQVKVQVAGLGQVIER